MSSMFAKEGQEILSWSTWLHHCFNVPSNPASPDFPTMENFHEDDGELSMKVN